MTSDRHDATITRQYLQKMEVGTMTDKRYIAYLRISTKEQCPDRQITDAKDYANKNNLPLADEDIYIEQASGKDFNRPVWQSLKQIALRPGITLIITELDRLGRDMQSIKDEWRYLNDKNVNIIVTENELLNTDGKSDLERTLISNIVFELLAYVAEKERQKLRTRQAQGIQQAREKGKYKGRKPIEVPADDFLCVYTRWRNKEITAVKAMELLSIKRDKFYSLVKEHEEKATQAA